MLARSVRVRKFKVEAERTDSNQSASLTWDHATQRTAMDVKREVEAEDEKI